MWCRPRWRNWARTPAMASPPWSSQLWRRSAGRQRACTCLSCDGPGSCRSRHLIASIHTRRRPAVARAGHGFDRRRRGDHVDGAGGHCVRSIVDHPAGQIAFLISVWTSTAPRSSGISMRSGPGAGRHAGRRCDDGEPARDRGLLRAQRPLAGYTPPASLAVTSLAANARKWRRITLPLVVRGISSTKAISRGYSAADRRVRT